MAVQWRFFETNLDNFHRTPILIFGEKDAMLVDGCFTLSEGRRLVHAIKASGKSLSMIFVTCADPDYYFGLAEVCKAFPEVRMAATPMTASVIAQTAAHKVDVWQEKLGADGPQVLADLTLPEPWSAPYLELEGERLDIISAQQPNRFHLWSPKMRAILGGVQVVSGIHVWMADTPLIEERASWIASLDDMLMLDPDAVVPGHCAPGAPAGPAAIAYTRSYIQAFDQELARARSSDELIAAMKGRYPDIILDQVLELGARVCFGEQVWP